GGFVGDLQWRRWRYDGARWGGLPPHGRRPGAVVAPSELTPFAVVVPLRPQGSAPIAAGQSLEQLEAALDALPYSASRMLAARVEGRFRAVAIRSEPQAAAALSPVGGCHESATGRPYARGGRRYPDRFPFPCRGQLGQRAGLAFPFSQRG